MSVPKSPIESADDVIIAELLQAAGVSASKANVIKHLALKYVENRLWNRFLASLVVLGITTVSALGGIAWWASEQVATAKANLTADLKRAVASEVKADVVAQLTSLARASESIGVTSLDKALTARDRTVQALNDADNAIGTLNELILKIQKVQADIGRSSSLAQQAQSDVEKFIKETENTLQVEDLNKIRRHLESLTSLLKEFPNETAAIDKFVTKEGLRATVTGLLSDGSIGDVKVNGQIHARSAEFNESVLVGIGGQGIWLMTGKDDEKGSRSSAISMGWGGVNPAEPYRRYARVPFFVHVKNNQDALFQHVGF